MKKKLVIFEGPDKSGKSTLYQAYRKATDYQPLVIDRWIGSQIVYDSIWGREDKSKDWHKHEKELEALYDVYLVVVTAPVSTLRRRITKDETDEKERKVALRTYREADELFRQYLEQSNFKNKILVDTSKPLKKSLEEILEFTGEENTGNKGGL